MLLISFLRSYFTLYTVKTVLVVYNVIYDSQFPLASSRFGRDSIQYRAGKTHCQGHQDPSKSVTVPIFLRGT